MLSSMDLCESLRKPGFCILLVPLSYVVYRCSRTLLAFARALLLYCVLPLVYRPSLQRFKMRWTVVTGATDGIGKAYTMELARRGIRKFLLIGRSTSKLEEVKSELAAKFEDCSVRTLLFDFFSGDYDELRDNLSVVDIGLVVNSVGVGRDLLERYGDNVEADRQLLRVNALGSAEFLSCILPPMEQNGGGQIVVLSSTQGVRPIPMLAAYSAAKSLMSFLSECIDREYSTISVQCLTPALVATKMTQYEEGSLFVVKADNFARQAVSVLGLVHRTTGCFNHEIQMLLSHMFPWTILKHILTPIYWRHQNRMLKLHERAEKKQQPTPQPQISKTSTVGSEKERIQDQAAGQSRSDDSSEVINITSPNTPPSATKTSKIPTSNGSVIRSRA